MKRNYLPTDLTSQGFQRLAERLPNLEGNWIYQVTRTVICEITDNMYPKFDIYEELPIWFLTFQEAETYIKELSAHTKRKDKELIYRFQITQYPLGCPAERGAHWLYDSEGSLITRVRDKFYHRQLRSRHDKSGELMQFTVLCAEIQCLRGQSQRTS